MQITGLKETEKHRDRQLHILLENIFTGSLFMASVKNNLTSKMTNFFYDHQTIPSKGKSLRHSYKEVEKVIQSIGSQQDKKK